MYTRYTIIRITYTFTYINYRGNSYTSIDRDDRCRADKRSLSTRASNIELLKKYASHVPFHIYLALLFAVLFVYWVLLDSYSLWSSILPYMLNSISSIWKNFHCLLYCPCHIMLSFYRSLPILLCGLCLLFFSILLPHLSPYLFFYLSMVTVLPSPMHRKTNCPIAAKLNALCILYNCYYGWTIILHSLRVYRDLYFKCDRNRINGQFKEMVWIWKIY